MRIIYSGLFLLDKLISKLDNPVEKQHITFGLGKSAILPSELIGKVFRVKIIGYGNDGYNEGYQVVLLDEELIRHYKGNPVVHITVATSNGSPAKHTANLDFEPLPKPFIVGCKLGYYTDNGVKYSNQFLYFSPDSVGVR